jgi:glycosyltransferase involved in cell wall biosynthesis
MTLTIITINYNNAHGLKKTMNSVLNQSFIDFEYIVIDGDSTDNSIEVLQSHKDERLQWISEPDLGVYNAMNKGIFRATGEYLLFLNSGDFLISNTILETVIPKIDFSCSFNTCNLLLDGETKRLRKYPKKISFSYLVSSSVSHPSTFIKSVMFEKYGLYNEKNKIISDWEFYFKTLGLNGESYHKIDETLTVFDMCGISSNGENLTLISEEKEAVYKKYLSAIYESEFDIYNFNNFRNPSKRIKLLMKIDKNPLIRKITTLALLILTKFVK